MGQSSTDGEKRLIKYTRLSQEQVELTINLFGDDHLSIHAARQVGISQRSMNRLYQLLRERLCNLGFDGVTISDEELDELFYSDEFMFFRFAREARARGWPKKHFILHEGESFQRFLRQKYAMPSVREVVTASLSRHPLGTLVIRSDWTYAACR